MDTHTSIHAHIETCTHTGWGQGYNSANVVSADLGGLDDVDMKLPYSAVAAFLCSLGNSQELRVNKEV